MGRFDTAHGQRFSAWQLGDWYGFTSVVQDCRLLAHLCSLMEAILPRVSPASVSGRVLSLCNTPGK
jgi:hypothetical protein